MGCSHLYKYVRNQVAYPSDGCKPPTNPRYPTMANINNNDKVAVRDWIVAHNADYAAVRDRLEYVRNIVLNGRIENAADIMRKSYVFAIMSIQTEKDRHEGAFIAHYQGNVELKEASLQTVYGGQKYDWMSRTFDSNDFEDFIRSLRIHVENGNMDTLLDTVVDNFTGVSYRKASFMLAMAGMYEYMCIDSNVGKYAGIGARDSYNSAEAYMADCREIYDSLDTPRQVPPFILQWAIYDYQRQEHARHMVYFNEVMAE